jgi:hypothetical protein
VPPISKASDADAVRKSSLRERTRVARKVSAATIRRRDQIEEKDRERRVREDIADKAVDDMIKRNIERHGP